MYFVGVLPGAGGTQRLPRLAGFTKAIEMIVFGDPVKGSQAVQCGIVDAVYTTAQLVEIIKKEHMSVPKKEEVCFYLPLPSAACVSVYNIFVLKKVCPCLKFQDMDLFKKVIPHFFTLSCSKML